ncbi:cytochrome c-type biogenesis protein [Micromonospora pattaloongensis]|uniref:Cytochrome c-type biogenesis protein n=1 Tax=Micromonospora pattaloongensis TaxID=405436 RepID=A0A1H3SGJ4_9ACTN|nr:cytochrome c biogenesis protein CcdA [Micromonospora pattaloongensis]SDZ36828.1 cytochrome c-type biogenesis protein [Micromonospora pattaloongensis]
MGETFENIANSGPLLLAIGAAALAGLVSFLSPCVLPLVPGYLSYVTGLAGSDLDASPTGRTAPAAGAVAVAQRSGRAVKGRVLAGTLLFIGGFTVVFTITAVVATTLGRALFTHRRLLEIIIGLLVIVLGLAFLGLIPGMQREFRIHRLPAAGLLGAPVFGAVFALSWVPCVGPTLGAVLGMAATTGRVDRAVVLAVAYCLGLGLPFVIFGLGFQRLLGLFQAIRRNSRWVTRAGGALLILVGLALLTGGWGNFIIWLQTTVGPGEVGI